MRDRRWIVTLAALLSLAAPPAGAQPRALSLADAVRIASGQSPVVAIAAQKVGEAKARVTQSRAALLPGLTGTASAENRTFNLQALGIGFPKIPGQPALPDLQGPVDAVDARLRVTETLVDPASWVRVGAAHRGVEASEADRAQSAETAAQTAALAYLRTARALAVVAARAADRDLADQLATLAAEQEKAGVSAHIDALRARTELVAARGQEIVARNQLDRAQIDLARALGLDPATRFALAESLSAGLGVSAVGSDSATALAMALARRPELAAERKRLEKARAERRAIGIERLPRVDVAADYGLSGANGPDAIPTREVSVALTVPFLDGFRREGRVSEQRSIERESEIRVSDLERQVAAEVQGAELDLATGRQQLDVAAEQLQLADEELAQARDRFVNGVASNIEVIDAQSALLRARDAVIDARYNTAVARVGIARAAGAAQTLH